jgi:hypothetical protein
VTLDLTSEGVRLEPAGKRHARELARIMRKADLDEVEALLGVRVAEQAVRYSINRSVETYAAYVGRDLLCVFGVMLMEGSQAVWMLSGTNVNKYQSTFYRCSKIVINYLRGKYPLMMNMVHSRYPAAIRWLERLGFVISQPEKFGARGDWFCRFMMHTPKLIEVAHV